ncbi:hypothetical protein B0J17DRAFT_581710 [Rhizoctonia solani]|nr:hypothetical protein B0J17DRAFT_581710 [Rhizoctonia solani]
MDTNEIIPTLENHLVFFVPRFGGANDCTEDKLDEHESEKKLEEVTETALKTLIETCGPPSESRFHTVEKTYVDHLQKDLYQNLEHRQNQVQLWIQENTKHLAPDNAGIRDLNDRFHALTRAMKAVVRLCQSGCSRCGLLCLRPYRHSGEHECGTNHRCIFSCDIKEAHNEDSTPVCGQSAGHANRHMCSIKRHSCGMECRLSHLSGCTMVCNKPLDHEGNHCCSARTHFCGKPCDLRGVKVYPNQQIYTCSGRCQQPWDEPHERHACDNARTCPLPCALCVQVPGRTSSCANDDHFHGLNSDQIHLCGATHKCSKLCEERGICGIELEPSRCESQFSGRHASFAYTRFTQVSKRQPCNVEISPWKMSHGGPHTHDPSGNSFHFCDVRCPGCSYFCTQPLGHTQPLHKTNHGSMVGGRWVIEDVDPTYSIDDQTYGQGDQGATMLCHMLCAKQGRHMHVDFCRDPDNHEQPLCKHIPSQQPESDQSKDWISHATYWERTDGKPISMHNINQLGSLRLTGPEHDEKDKKSWCTLPIFHLPQGQNPRLTYGHVSHDGHRYDCPDPSLVYQPYHVVFLIDVSGSMWGADKCPVPGLPITDRLVSECNNRYGAVVSALYCFWKSQEKVASRSVVGTRRDAYSLVTFDDQAKIKAQNDLESTVEQLVDFLVPQQSNGWYYGTNFGRALETAKEVIKRNWNNNKYVINSGDLFLSDGEGSVNDEILADLCNTCISLGHALSFYAVLFGDDSNSTSLRNMVEFTKKHFQSAPSNAKGNFISQEIPCKYSNAMDSVQLMDEFLGISESLTNMRAAVINQGGTSGR